MTLLDAKRKIQLSLDAMTEEQYEAVRKCITQGAGLLLTEGIDERTQICLNLQVALEFLYEDCQKAGLDVEQIVENWQGGTWETSIACFILQVRLGRIKEIADSI